MTTKAKRGRPAGPGSVTIRVPLRLAPIFAAIVREYRAMARLPGYDGERTDASEPEKLDDASSERDQLDDASSERDQLKRRET